MLKNATCVLVTLAALAACGNDLAAQAARSHLPKGQQVKALLTGLFVKPNPTPVDPIAVVKLRVALEQAGQPVIFVKVPSLGYANLFAPYGENGDVITWANATYQSVALKGGVLVATRGFGPDLMSAKVPTLAQVRRASGKVQRDYYELDGADQKRRYHYDCTFAPVGPGPVDVFGKTYAARKVIESCAGPDMTFENAYWFDVDGILRRSQQHAGPSLPMVQIDRLVD